MRTDFETLKTLASYIINHLKEAEFVIFPADARADLIDSLATELGVCFSTDEDIKQQAIEEVEEKFGEVEAEDITETEMFNHARKEIIKSFQGESIAGLYLVESLNHVANRVRNFLLSSEHVEDVFSTDEDLVLFLIDRIRGFNPRNL
ncbi:MAG: DUF507 family protein [Bacteriovoracaceae bacterium]|nr:DUF507 family protein [Bacteriovoracaceae bacterium]